MFLYKNKSSQHFVGKSSNICDLFSLPYIACTSSTEEVGGLERGMYRPQSEYPKRDKKGKVIKVTINLW